jgi:DNA-directed RNA polymerase alpha subunit/DNA-directed RNA polymerase subunit L
MTSTYFENFQRHSVLNRSTFRLRSLDVGVVNAVRRVIMSYLPTLAVGFDPYNKDANDVTFHKNTTTLHNEILGHRISMIPLHLRVNDTTTYRFEINVTNSTQETIVVTTDHIKCSVENSPEVYSELPESSTRTIFPLDPVTGDPIIITKLKPREELHVTFKTRKGYGYQNACWSPVSVCSYTFVVDEAKAQAALDAKLKEIGTDEERQENYKKVFNTLDRHRYFHTNQYGEPTLYDFQIEVENGSDPIDLVTSAFHWLEEKLGSLQPTIEKTGDDFYLLTFPDAEHTIGNLLQTLFFREHVRQSGEVTYVGYNVPHPLEKIMIMKMKVKTGIELESFLENTFQIFKSFIEGIRKDWEAFTADMHRSHEVHMLLTPTQPPNQKPKAPARKKKPAVDEEAADEPPAPTPAPKPRAPARKKKAAVDEEAADEPPAPAPKPKAPARKKTVAVDEEAADEPPTPAPKPKAPARKKTVAVNEEAADEPPAPKPKAPARKKKVAVKESGEDEPAAV